MRISAILNSLAITFLIFGYAVLPARTVLAAEAAIPNKAAILINIESASTDSHLLYTSYDVLAARESATLRSENQAPEDGIGIDGMSQIIILPIIGEIPIEVLTSFVLGGLFFVIGILLIIVKQNGNKEK